MNKKLNRPVVTNENYNELANKKSINLLNEVNYENI